MPEGIFLIGWSNILGSYIEAKYPDNSSINEEEIIKYLATIQVLSTSNAFQINDGNRIALFYGIPKKISSKNLDVNYDFMVLMLNQEETIEIDNYHVMLRKFALEIIVADKVERKKMFLKFARNLFTHSTKKIVFLGLPESGKTSTKMFLFDKIKEDQLLTTTITPTQGVEITHYKFIDVNISLFDTSGQELLRWLDDNENILVSSELIIFFFSITNWRLNKEQVIYSIQKLSEIIKKMGDNSIQINIFCHKSDLLTEDAEVFKNDVKVFTNSLNLNVFFTSIKNGGNQDLILGTQLILQKFSNVYSLLQELINPIINNPNTQLLLIMDSNFRILFDYDSNKLYEEDKDAYKKFLPALILNYEKTFDQNLNFFIMESKIKNQFILTLNLKNISTELEFIAVIINRIESIAEIYSMFEEKFKEIDWPVKKVG